MRKEVIARLRCEVPGWLHFGIRGGSLSHRVSTREGVLKQRGAYWKLHFTRRSSDSCRNPQPLTNKHGPLRGENRSIELVC